MSLVVFPINCLYVLIIHGFQVERDILERLKYFNTPASLELVHERACEYTFTCAMTQVDKRATWIVVSIMPAIRVFIFPSLLNPLENLEETLELYLAVG